MAEKRLLVFRFSSLGDVAMTVPVIKLLLAQHPRLQIIMVSSEFMRPLFSGIDRVTFHPLDKKEKHKGIAGLCKLFSELKDNYDFDAIADLHDVLRTKVLRKFFTFSNINIATIDKGRKEKNELTRKHNKILRPLKTTFERYADVFAELGFPVELHKEGSLKNRTFKKTQNEISVGIAPFALHEEKIYPLEKMKEVVRLLSLHPQIKIYFFGAKEELKILSEWQKDFPDTVPIFGKSDFEEELSFISSLDLMISMDSANMHLASIYGVPVISIWGGTHPYIGFYGWGQPYEYAIQANIACRPSSVYGNKKCYNDLACMKMISPLEIYEKAVEVLKL